MLRPLLTSLKGISKKDKVNKILGKKLFLVVKRNCRPNKNPQKKSLMQVIYCSLETGIRPVFIAYETVKFVRPYLFNERLLRFSAEYSANAASRFVIHRLGSTPWGHVS